METEKYSYGDLVSFSYKGERYVGKIYLTNYSGKEITYDINVGGEAPFIAKAISPDSFVLLKKSEY